VQDARPRDIVAKVEKLLNEGEPLAKGFRDVAEVNDAFVAGNQYGGVTFKNSQTVITKDEWFDDEDVPRIHVNILGNLVATLVSLLTKNRPCAVNRALNEDDPESVYQGEVANTLIRYLSQELKTVEVIQKALKLAVTHGSGGIKVWFNPKTQKAEIAPVSIFNVTIDPCAEVVGDAGHFIFHRWIPVNEAQKAVAKVGFDRKKPRDEEYTTASGVKKRGVKSRELWIRPGFDDEYPKGLYAFVVDDIVVEQKPYPLIVPTEGGEESLPPLVWITARPVDECVYGRTSVTDCVPIQRTLNETFSRTLKYLRLNSSPKLLRPDTIAEGIDVYRDAELPFPVTEAGVQAAKIMGWMQGPPIPREAFDLREFCIKQIHDIIGVAPLTAGTETRNVSGKALEEIEGLDQQKNSQTTRSLETAVLDLYRALLAIVQTRYDDGRKLQIVGGSRSEVMLFNSADVMGKDLRLEPASEFDLMQPTQEQNAVERQQSGLSTQADLHAAERDPRHAYSRQLAERLVGQMLAGQDIDISQDDVDVESFKLVIAKHKHLAMLEGRKADYLALVELEKFVDELAASAGNTAAPAEPAPTSEPPAAPVAPAPQGPVQ
jgi:hypothetical protein